PESVRGRSTLVERALRPCSRPRLEAGMVEVCLSLVFHSLIKPSGNHIPSSGKITMITSQQETMSCKAALPDLQRACVPERVAAQAIQRPDAVAVWAGSQPLTYRDLEDRSNRLARHLRSLGVDRDVPVGLYLPRSLDVVVGALGILKARGAYLPLDPSY